MSDQSIKATGRKDEGKGASRRLRHAAKSPAIVYGGQSAPRSIQLEPEKSWVASQNEWFYSSILSLDIDGAVERVLLRDMQRHPFKQQIMHLDFQRVNENEAIRVSVPLHFINIETSPAGKMSDVIVMRELTEIQVSCLPGNLPAFIEVDLAQLAVGDIIHLSELKLPAGIELPELKLGKEHDVAVVVAKHGRVEAAEATEAADAAEASAASAAAAAAAAAPAKPVKKDDK
jgi:large subunit ribosomal protein L25